MLPNNFSKHIPSLGISHQITLLFNGFDPSGSLPTSTNVYGFGDDKLCQTWWIIWLDNAYNIINVPIVGSDLRWNLYDWVTLHVVLTSPISHFRVHPNHGCYPPIDQTHAKGLIIHSYFFLREYIYNRKYCGKTSNKR
jgi:hypothetical protein